MSVVGVGVELALAVVVVVAAVAGVAVGDPGVASPGAGGSLCISRVVAVGAGVVVGVSAGNVVEGQPADAIPQRTRVAGPPIPARGGLWRRRAGAAVVRGEAEGEWREGGTWHRGRAEEAGEGGWGDVGRQAG